MGQGIHSATAGLMGKLFVVLLCAGSIWCLCPRPATALPTYKQDGGDASAERDRARISVLMATGMPGGTYYHVGLGLASLWTTKLLRPGIRVSAAISEGSGENIEAIRIADADLILVEELFASMAYNGTGLYKGRPVRDLRSISALWPEAVQLLVRSDKTSRRILEDLEGLTLATGLQDSGSRFTTEMLLKTLKSGKQKVRVRSMSYTAAAEALKNGSVQAVDATGGIPVPFVTSLLHEGKPPLGFLQITDAQLEAVREEGWKNAVRSVIPPGTYPGQDQPVNSIGQMNVLATSSSLDPQVVYALTKTLYENLDYLVRVHPSCRSLSLENALEGLTAPLHRGAVLYYTERKIKIPEHLLP